MKTQNEILTLIIDLIKSTPLLGLSGGIYKNTRPTDSALEDTVVSLIPGITGKIEQEGALLVKVFYADIFLNNSYFEDSLRGEDIEEMLYNLSELFINLSWISLFKNSREFVIDSNQDYQFKEHFITLKINYKIV